MIRYDIEVDERWHTRSARIDGWSAGHERSLQLTGDGEGHWQVNGDAFGFRARLEYDASGLVLDYPGITRRVL